MFLENHLTLKAIQKSLAIFLCVFQVYLLLQFASGIITAFGRSVSLIRALELFLDFFTEFGVTHTIIGVTYFCVLIVIIKQLISSCKYFKRAFSGGRDQETMDAIIGLFDRSQKTVFGIIVFLVITRLFTTYKLNRDIITLFIIICLFSICAKFAILVWERKEVITPLCDTLYNTVFYTCIFIFTILVCNAQLPNLLNSLKYLFKVLANTMEFWSYKIVLDTLFSFAIEPIFYILLQIFALIIINNALLLFDYENTVILNRVKTAVSISAIFVAVVILVFIYDERELSLSIIEYVKPYVSIFLCSSALLSTFNFPKYSCLTEEFNSYIVEHSYSEFTKNASTFSDISRDYAIQNNITREQKVSAIIKKFGKQIPTIKRFYFEEQIKKASVTCLDSAIRLKVKRKGVALSLSIILGIFGIDRFYLGDIIFGLEKLIFSIISVLLIYNQNVGGCIVLAIRVIWGITDFILVYRKSQKINFDNISTLFNNNEI